MTVLDREALFGARIHRLTILAFYSRLPRGRRGSGQNVICRCDCGRTVDTMIGALRSGNTRSCGCITKERRHTPRVSLGQVFGDLRVESKVEGFKPLSYRCRCACGQVVTVKSWTLLAGHRGSCGTLEHAAWLAPIGKRQGRLTVVGHEWLDPKHRRRRVAVARCDCGRMRYVKPRKYDGALTRANGHDSHLLQSCGCLSESFKHRRPPHYDERTAAASDYPVSYQPLTSDPARA